MVELDEIVSPYIEGRGDSQDADKERCCESQFIVLNEFG